MKKSLATLGVLAVAALALSGCTDSAAPPAASPDSSGSTEPMEMHHGPRRRAADRRDRRPLGRDREGIFADHGPRDRGRARPGWCQAIPALLSGDIQFAIGQPFGPIRADRRTSASSIDRQLRQAARGRRGRERGRRARRLRHHATRRSRGQEGLGQHDRRRGDVTIRKAVQDDGGDPSTIEFVEVAFPTCRPSSTRARWTPRGRRTRSVAIVVGGGGTSVLALPGDDSRICRADQHHHAGAHR
jgi:NitT/TauT family transport system substrate-binding protein